MAVLLLFIITTKGNKASTTEIKGKIKRSKSRVLYYHNTSATFYIILKADDVEKNPGPGLHQQSNVTDPVVTAPRNRMYHRNVQYARKELVQAESDYFVPIVMKYSCHLFETFQNQNKRGTL